MAGCPRNAQGVELSGVLAIENRLIPYTLVALSMNSAKLEWKKIRMGYLLAIVKVSWLDEDEVIQQT